MPEKIFDPSEVLRTFLDASRDGERQPTGYVGRSDTDNDIFEGLPSGQVWVRLDEQPDPYAAYYTDASALKLNAGVALRFDVAADRWVIQSISVSEVSYATGGTDPFPFVVPPHDHSETDELQIPSAGLQDSAVTTSKIANANVTTAKIADANVTNAKLATDSVNTANLINASVTLAKIARQALGSLLVGKGASTDVAALPAGTDGHVLTLVTGEPVWQPASGGGGADPNLTYVTIADETADLPNSTRTPSFNGNVETNAAGGVGNYFRVNNNVGGYALYVSGQGRVGVGKISETGAVLALLAGNSTLAAVRFNSQSDKTSSLNSGELWYNSGVFKYYDGTVTQTISVGSGLPGGAANSVVYWNGSAWVASDSPTLNGVITTGNGTFSGNVTANDGSSPVAFFRANSSTRALIFASSADNAVGIGTATPSGDTTLQINPTSGDSSLLLVASNPTASGIGDGNVWHDSTDKTLNLKMSGVEQAVQTVIYKKRSTATVANTTTETAFSMTSGWGTLTLPANFFGQNSMLEFEGWGYISNTGTTTGRVRVYFGSTVVATTGNVTVTSLANDLCYFKFSLFCYTTGASGNIWGHGLGQFGGFISSNTSASVATINTAASQAIAVRWTWGAASASNTVTLTNFIIKAQ
jgi:hypothetical protein